MTQSKLLSIFLTCIASCVGPFLHAQNTAADGWTPLFNGKDLTGWKFVGKGYNEVKDGLLQTGVHGEGLLYWTGGKVGHCTIRVVYRMLHENDNSGVFIRIPVEPHEDEMPINYGYEVQIDNHPEASGEDEYHVTGTLYSLTRPLAKPGRAGPKWNTMEIAIDGPRTVVMLNGVKVTDYTEGGPVPDRKLEYEPIRGPRPDEGWVGLQSESVRDVVLFKEVSLRPLK